MKDENIAKRGQIKGYLFEIVVFQLLTHQGFFRTPMEKGRIKEKRSDFVEVRGRGDWHQIDCPCDYKYTLPFMYPIRLLGEVKFHEKPIQKNDIRTFIGVMKDIQENYFAPDNRRVTELTPRKLDIGVFFSASGFIEAAEKLAYAHGIKTVSYANNVLIDEIKDIIEKLESDYISFNMISKENRGLFKAQFQAFLTSDNVERQGSGLFDYFIDNRAIQLLVDLYNIIHDTKTSFIGTTATNEYIHFVSRDEFPNELFANTDEANCKIFFTGEGSKKAFYLTFSNEEYSERRYYFTPPKSLEKAAKLGLTDVLYQKERHFQKVYVNKTINEINRNLVLKIDKNWLDAVRNARI